MLNQATWVEGYMTTLLGVRVSTYDVGGNTIQPTTHSLCPKTQEETIPSDSWYFLKTSLLLLGFSPTIFQLSLNEVICHTPLLSGCHSCADFFLPSVISFPVLCPFFPLTLYGYFSGVLGGSGNKGKFLICKCTWQLLKVTFLNCNLHYDPSLTKTLQFLSPHNTQ